MQSSWSSQSSRAFHSSLSFPSPGNRSLLHLHSLLGPLILSSPPLRNCFLNNSVEWSILLEVWFWILVWNGPVCCVLLRVEPARNQTASEQLFNSAGWGDTECFWILFTAKNALTSPFDLLEGNHRYSSDWKCRWFQLMCNKGSEEWLGVQQTGQGLLDLLLAYI